MTEQELTKLFKRQLAAAKPFEEKDFEPYDQLDELAKRLIPDEKVYEDYKQIRIGKKALFYMVDNLGQLKSAILKTYDVDLERLAPLVKLSTKAKADGMASLGGALPRLEYHKEFHDEEDTERSEGQDSHHPDRTEAVRPVGEPG